MTATEAPAPPAAPAALSEPLILAGKTFRSRLIVGTGKYATFPLMREALEESGIELAVWRIHRRIGMSGGLLIDALLREIGRRVTKAEAEHLAQLHEDAYARLSTSGSRAPRPP